MKPTQVQSQVKRILSDSISSLKDPRIPMIVTVEHVAITPDYSLARVYVSAINTDMPVLIEALRHARGYLQKEISQHVKMRRTPVLEFYPSSEAPI